MILNQTEVMEALTEWLDKRGIKYDKATFEINMLGGERKLVTTIHVSEIKVHDGPYR